jgi:hypothetical protein
MGFNKQGPGTKDSAILRIRSGYFSEQGLDDMIFRGVAGVSVVVGAASLAVLLGPRPSTASCPLAEAQAPGSPARTMIARVDRQRVPPAKVAEEPYRMLIRAPSVVRVEQPDGSYSITDFARRKALVVDPAKKSVRVFEGLNSPGGLPDRDVYDLFRSIAEKPIKSVPARLIAGKDALGFVVPNPMPGGGAGGPKMPEAQTTAWVDPQTKVPLRIETVMREDGATTTEITSIIAFDRPLDPKLFDLTPPEGYKVETFGVAALQPEPAAKAKDAAEMVVTPLVGIGPVEFGMKADDVIRRLGKPDKTVSPNKDYTLLEYYSRGFSVHTTTQRGAMMVMCYTGKFFAFRVRDFAGRTDKGIKMGANRAAIEKAYGKPTSVREATMKDVFGKQANDPDKKTGQVDLTYAGLNLSFSLHDDALDSIMINAPRPPRQPAAAPKEKAAK